MTRSSKAIVFLVVFGISIWIIWLKAEAKEKVDNIKTEQPQITNIYNKRLISGVLLPAKEIIIKSQISGILEELYVEVGGKIKIGEKIAKIKLIADPNNVEIAKRNLNTTKINFENEAQNFKRNSELIKNGFISIAKFEKVERTYKLAKEEFYSAKKQLQIIRDGHLNGQKDVSNIVTSTLNGTILELPINEGASVIERNNFNEGTTIATVADLDSLIFKGRVNESDIMFLNENHEFEIFISALNGITTQAKLVKISPKGIEHNGIMKFDIEAQVVIPKEAKLIRSGFTAVACIILEKRENVLTINEKNLFSVNDTTYVELVRDGGMVVKRKIKTGLSDGLRIEIIEGLSIEDKIKMI